MSVFQNVNLNDRPEILIVKLSAIGDVIHTLPALHAIRRHFPGARITWLVEEAAAPLVLGHPDLDRVLVSRRKSWLQGGLKSAGEIQAFIRALRDTRYDLVFDFQALLKSALLIGLCRAGRKIGFGPGLSHMEHSYLFLNERIPAVDMEIHALKRGLMLLDAVGIPSQEVVYNLPVTGADRLRALELLCAIGFGKSGPILAIHPVAKWDTKMWPDDRFSVLADRFMDRWGARVIFTGGREDRERVGKIIARMKGKALDLTGRTSLTTLAAVFERMDAVVSTDTGPMHLAAAVGKPVVALFGPTAPWRTGPYGYRHRIVRADLSCSPCFRRRCDNPVCMEGIGVEDVLVQVDSLLSKGQAPPAG